MSIETRIKKLEGEVNGTKSDASCHACGSPAKEPPVPPDQFISDNHLGTAERRQALRDIIDPAKELIAKSAVTEWCHVCRRSRTTRWHDNAAEAEYHQLEERAGALLDKFKREDTTKMEGTKP